MSLKNGCPSCPEQDLQPWHIHTLLTPPCTLCKEKLHKLPSLALQAHSSTNTTWSSLHSPLNQTYFSPAHTKHSLGSASQGHGSDRQHLAFWRTGWSVFLLFSDRTCSRHQGETSGYFILHWQQFHMVLLNKFFVESIPLKSPFPTPEKGFLHMGSPWLLLSHTQWLLMGSWTAKVLASIFGKFLPSKD